MTKKTYYMFVHDGGAGDGGFYCEFPDLPGCMTDGDDLDDLMKNAADAMEPVTGYLSDRPVRINITSTESKIAEITAFAKKVGRTRSELMVDATLEYVRANA